MMAVYSPNAFHKMKWNTAEKIIDTDPNEYKTQLKKKYDKIKTLTIIGDCSSIPTSFWTTLTMNVMVYVDLLVSSLVPFAIMIACNIIIIKKLFENRIKVILIFKYQGM